MYATYTGASAVEFVKQYKAAKFPSSFKLFAAGGLTGLAVGILNVHDHFTIPAIAPLVWNIVIIGGMVGLAPLFEGDDRLYAYAIGVVAGTLVQLLMMIPALRAIGFPV